MCWTTAIYGITSLFGCGPEVDAQPVTCGEIIDEASYQTEIEDQIEWFDTAIKSCGSYNEFVSQMERKGRVVGYSIDEFVRGRCQDSQPLATTEVCLVAAPPTTIAEVEEDPEYLGTTLDGRQITIRPGPDVVFVGSEPEEIAKTVQVAQAGAPAACVALLQRRDDFAGLVQPQLVGNPIQDNISVYAQHAQSVADFIGCLSVPVGTPSAPTDPGDTPEGNDSP